MTPVLEGMRKVRTLGYPGSPELWCVCYMFHLCHFSSRCCSHGVTPQCCPQMCGRNLASTSLTRPTTKPGPVSPSLLHIPSPELWETSVKVTEMFVCGCQPVLDVVSGRAQIICVSQDPFESLQMKICSRGECSGDSALGKEHDLRKIFSPLCSGAVQERKEGSLEKKN